MSSPFVDQSERDYAREQEALERLGHLKLVRNEVAGGDGPAEEEVARLARDFGEAMGSRCLILADFAREKGFPDFSKGVDGFVDAVIAACELYADRKQADGFVPVTDEELADLMGRSARTLANARNEWRRWPGHTKAIEVKDNYQNPETLESVPHRYRPHITRMSAESTLHGRINPKAREDKAAAFREEAGVTVSAAKGYVSRPPKRRRPKTQAEMLMADAEAVVKRLKAAAARPVSAGHVNYERLEELHRQMREALAEFEDAFGFESPTSIQRSNTDKEEVEVEASAAPDVEPDERRVEAENCDFSEVAIFSTSEKSQFFDGGPDADLSEWVWMESGEVQYRFPPPNKSSPELERAIPAQVARLEGKGAAMPRSSAEITLIRNALAAERPPAKVSPLQARRPSRLMPLPEVSAEVREEYAYALTELAGRYMDGDARLSEGDADRLAAADLGPVEYWDYITNERWREPEQVAAAGRVGDFEGGDITRQLKLWVRLSYEQTLSALEPAPPREVERVVGFPDPGLRCGRCESIGHEVAACPFSPLDKDVLGVAAERRGRRAGRGRVA